MGTDKFITTERRKHPDQEGCTIRVRYGFHYIKGNRRPYFSITCDIYERGRDVGGGAAHDDIAKAFPELQPLIKWHLVDDDGMAMHYVANGTYWLEKHFGIFRTFPTSDPDAPDPKGMEHFRSTTKMGLLPDDDEKLAECLAVVAEGADRDRPDPNVMDERARVRAVAEWLPERIPALNELMRKDMEEFGIEYIELAEETS